MSDMFGMLAAQVRDEGVCAVAQERVGGSRQRAFGAAEISRSRLLSVRLVPRVVKI